MKTFIKSLTALVVALTTFVSCQDFADFIFNGVAVSFSDMTVVATPF